MLTATPLHGGDLYQQSRKFYQARVSPPKPISRLCRRILLSRESQDRHVSDLPRVDVRASGEYKRHSSELVVIRYVRPVMMFHVSTVVLCSKLENLFADRLACLDGRT